MYESPITMILGEMQTQFEDECIKTVQSCGFYVDKEELKAALMFDREQYSKGYADGYNKAIDDFASILIPRLTDAIHPQDVASMTNLINDVSEELKAGE